VREREREKVSECDEEMVGDAESPSTEFCLQALRCAFLRPHLLRPRTSPRPGFVVLGCCGLVWFCLSVPLHHPQAILITYWQCASIIVYFTVLGGSVSQATIALNTIYLSMLSGALQTSLGVVSVSLGVVTSPAANLSYTTVTVNYPYSYPYVLPYLAPYSYATPYSYPPTRMPATHRPSLSLSLRLLPAPQRQAYL